MTITKRTLERWRKEALCDVTMMKPVEGNKPFSTDSSTWKEVNERILRLTQVLLDQHLIRRKS